VFQVISFSFPNPKSAEDIYPFQPTFCSFIVSSTLNLQTLLRFIHLLSYFSPLFLKSQFKAPTIKFFSDILMLEFVKSH